MIVATNMAAVMRLENPRRLSKGRSGLAKNEARLQEGENGRKDND